MTSLTNVLAVNNIDIEWILFLLIIALSLIGYFLFFKYNNCTLILISNILFIIYGTIMGLISKD